MLGVEEAAWHSEAAAMSKSQARVVVPKPKWARVEEVEKQTDETIESIMDKKEELERVKKEPETCGEVSSTKPIRSRKRKKDVWRERLQWLISYSETNGYYNAWEWSQAKNTTCMIIDTKRTEPCV